MKLSNIKNSPITSILGTLLIVTGVFYVVYPLFKKDSEEVSSIILTILFSFGSILLVSPDDIIPFINSKK